MSSRTGSELGALSQRTDQTKRIVDGREGPVRHVEVTDGDQTCAGVLAGWQRGPVGWLAHVAWVRQGQLVVGLVDAGRVRPVGR